MTGADRPTELADSCRRILASSTLGERSRLRDFLRFIVQEEAAGRGERLKAYAIGTQVFGRSADFDPNSDSIVRVEANRLRQALEHYYATEGQNDRFRLTIPRGSYRPVVEVPPAAPVQSGGAQQPGPGSADAVPPSKAATVAGHPRDVRRRQAVGRGLRVVWSLLPIVLIMVIALLQLEDHSAPRPVVNGQQARPDILRLRIAPGSTDPMEAAALAGVREISARFWGYVVQLLPADQEPDLQAYPEDYRVTVDSVRVSDTLVIYLQAVHVPSQTVISTKTVALSGAELLKTSYDDLVAVQGAMATMLQRNGPLFAHYEALGQASPVMRCVLLAENYFSLQTADRHAEAVGCAEDLLSRGVRHPNLLVGLAFMYREAHTDQHPVAEGIDPLKRALDLAQEAGRRAPRDALPPYAEMTLYALQEDEAAMLRAGRAAVDLNPSDAEIVAGFASRLNHQGHHAEALALLTHAEQLQPVAANWRHYAFFLAYYGLDQLEQAAAHTDPLFASQNPLYVAARIIAHRIRGQEEQARLLTSTLEILEVGFHQDPRAMYERRRYHPALIDRLVSDLMAAY